MFIVCTSACTCVEADARYRPQLLSTLIFETRPLTEPGAYRFGEAVWSASPRDPPVSTTQFFTGAGI